MRPGFTGGAFEEPRAEPLHVLIHAEGRDHHAVAVDVEIRGIVGAVGHDLHLRIAAVDLTAVHRAAEHDLVPAPGVIAAVAVRNERATEIARGEGRDVLQSAGRQIAIVVLSAQLHVKLAQRGVEHLKVARVRIGEAVVMIPSAEADEKDLPRGIGAGAVACERAGAHVFDDVRHAAQRIG